jgi:hypothetical protein
VLVGDGSFTFVPGSSDFDGPRWPLGEVLAEVDDRITRWRAISEVLPSLDVVVRTVPVAADAAPVHLDAPTWNVALALDGTRRVRDVTLVVGGDAFVTMEAVHDLVVRGLAEVVPEVVAEEG